LWQLLATFFVCHQANPLGGAHLRAMRTARYSGAQDRRVFKRHCELL
jgi:hypothetical protein